MRSRTWSLVSAHIREIAAKAFRTAFATSSARATAAPRRDVAPQSCACWIPVRGNGRGRKSSGADGAPDELKMVAWLRKGSR